IDAAWLADNGYQCYLAAFARYRNARPESETVFRQLCLESVGGPFDFRGVFVDSKLAGYMKCIVGADYIACVVLKLDPAYLSARIAYVLKDSFLRKYVAEEGKVAHDGFRAVSHETNAHDFFLRFGYRRAYCDLQVCYRPVLGAMVRVLYPFRRVV